MNICAINQNPVETNFKAVYRVRSVTINGEYIGQKHKQQVYNTARAFSNSLRFKTLAEQVRQKAYKFFKDYQQHPFIFVARTPEPVYKQKIIILTGNDADEYLVNCGENIPSEVRLDKLTRLLKQNGNKEMRISATEINGQLTITDIEEIINH